MTERDRPLLAPDDELSGFVDLSTVAPLLEVLAASHATPPVLPDVTPATLDARLPVAVPRAPTDLAEVLDELRTVAVAGRRKNGHPGFFGYVCGPGLPTDPAAHALTAALNQNLTAYTSAPGPTIVERRVIAWLAALVGLPETAGGMFTSGGSLANFQALATATYNALGDEVRDRGLRHARATPVVLATHEAHFSIARACVLLGLGRENLRVVATDDTFRMDPDALNDALAQVLVDGDHPVCVVASAGTATTGAIDPLEAIADVCAEHGVWLHVDAAYGGGCILDPEARTRLGALDRADSIGMDLHKWFYLSFDASTVLYRDPEPARRLHFLRADYVQLPPELPPEVTTFFDRGPETSRRFRALAAYLAFRHYGVDRLGRNVAHNNACAAHLAALVEAADDLELVAAPQLSICCFRYRPPGLSDDAVDEANRVIRQALEDEGAFYLSPTVIDGRPVLRACIISHATRAEHVEGLVARVRALGAR